MPWVYLDDKFDQHPKVVQAGSDAGWMFVAGLCWVNRNLTEGRIPASAVRLLTDKRPAPLIERLVDVGLWERQHDGSYLVHDYAYWNRTAKAMSEKARKAAERRWENERKAQAEAEAEQCSSIAGADAQALPGQSLSNAHAGARAPGPLSHLPSPLLGTSPSDLSNGAAQPVENETIEVGGGGELVARLTSACAVKSPKARAEAMTVVNLCRQHIDDRVIDEAIGYMLTLEKRPQLPRYLLGMMPKWAEQRGVQIPKLELPESA